MKITLCNQKGGAGKTTLTVLMASALAEVGHEVAVLDRDPQKTATRWIEGLEMPVKIAGKGKAYDYVFIDTPGSLQSKAVLESVAESDRIILATSPSPADLWSSQDAASMILKKKKQGAKASILFNKVVSNARLSRNLDDLAASIGLPSLKCQIPQRQSYQHAAVIGWPALAIADKALIQQATLAIVG